MIEASNEGVDDTFPTVEKRKKSVQVSHGFTADGLTPQSSFGYIFNNKDLFLYYLILFYEIIVLMIRRKNQNLNQL